MTIPHVERVADNHASGSGSSAQVTVDTSGGHFGMLLTWWVWQDGTSSINSLDYDGHDGSVLDTDTEGAWRLSQGYLRIHPEWGNASGVLDVSLSASVNWWVAAHVYRYVDFNDPLRDHLLVYGNPLFAPQRFWAPPGSMLTTAMFVGTSDYQESGVTVVRTVVDGRQETGEDPDTSHGQEGWVHGGWTHTGTSRDGISAWMILNPARSSLPRRQLWNRRDRMSVSAPISRAVQP